MHPHTKSDKEERINIRASHLEKRLIATASRLSMIRPAQFARQAILEKAQRIIAEANHLTLSQEDWNKFIVALDQEPKEIPALKKLFSKKTLFD